MKQKDKLEALLMLVELVHSPKFCECKDCHPDHPISVCRECDQDYPCTTVEVISNR